MPTLRAEIAFATGANLDAWALGAGALASTAVLGPADIDVYTDVATDLRTLTIQRGKAREVDQYQVGIARIGLDNRSRDYDPLNLSGPYVSGGVTQVRPGRRCRILATHPTTLVEYPIYAGFVWEWALDYTGQFDSVANARAMDLMANLANVIVDVTTIAGETGQAAADVLDAAGVSGYSVAECDSTIQATHFTQSALSALRTLEESEQGAFYVERDGVVQFANRHALMTDSRSTTSQATFGTAPLDYEDIAITYESDLIKNSATLTRTGGAAQSASDATSIADYGTRSIALSGLANSTDSEVLGMASYLVNRWKDPKVRVASISFSARKSPELMTQALSRRIRDRVTVEFSPVGGGTISQDLFIVGIKHEVSPAKWKTTFTFENTEYADTSFALGAAALGSTAVLRF